MDIKSLFEDHKTIFRQVPILILVSLIVISGIILVFIQFNTDRVPDLHLAHVRGDGTVYFELDDIGNRNDLSPEYNEAGFLEHLSGSAFLDDAFDLESDEALASQRHRIGFSRILTTNLINAQLDFFIKDDVLYIIFLDDLVLFSDFPEPLTALGAAFNNDTENEPDPDRLAQRILFSLPQNYVGMTLNVIEFITPEQALWWSPAVLDIITPGSEGLTHIFSLGSQSVIAGAIGAIVIFLLVIFAFQLFAGKQTCWLLLLPIVYGSLIMIRMAFVQSFSDPQFWFLQIPMGFISSITFFCGGDLLLIFLAARLNNRLKYILVTAIIVHLSASVWYVVYNFITYDYATVNDMPILGIFGFLCILFTFILMIAEGKENRYFTLSFRTLLALVTGYITMMLVTRFTNPGMFFELASPMSLLEQFMFFALNDRLYILILFLILILSIDECMTDTADRRSQSSALDLADHMKTDFLGNISQELKTPLTSVSVLGRHSYSMMTEDKKLDATETDELRDNLRIIVVESDRMKKVIDGLLNVATIEQNDFELNKEYFSVPDLIQEISGVQFRAMNINDNTLKFSFASDLPRIHADRDRLREVLLNLLSNASRHTTKGTIVLSVKPEQRKLLISVSDNGEGIPEDMQKNLFKRFLGADTGRAHGTGLGLYICKQIVELHKGRIRIESKSGNGTTVFIELPVEKAKA